MYFASFSYYVMYLSKENDNDLNFKFMLEIACIVICGKQWIHFTLLELIQMGRSKCDYFTDFWNLIDLVSLGLNAAYVIMEIQNTHTENQVNMIGSIAIAIMWVKMFYWMRIFKSYAAFIRMV